MFSTSLSIICMDHCLQLPFRSVVIGIARIGSFNGVMMLGSHGRFARMLSTSLRSIYPHIMCILCLYALTKKMNLISTAFVMTYQQIVHVYHKITAIHDNIKFIYQDATSSWLIYPYVIVCSLLMHVY